MCNHLLRSERDIVFELAVQQRGIRLRLGILSPKSGQRVLVVDEDRRHEALGKVVKRNSAKDPDVR